jgi:hypothetical protein
MSAVEQFDIPFETTAIVQMLLGAFITLIPEGGSDMKVPACQNYEAHVSECDARQHHAQEGRQLEERG